MSRGAALDLARCCTCHNTLEGCRPVASIRSSRLAWGAWRESCRMAHDSIGSSTILLRLVPSGRRFDVMAEKPLTGRGQRPAPHERHCFEI